MDEKSGFAEGLKRAFIGKLRAEIKVRVSKSLNIEQLLARAKREYFQELTGLTCEEFLSSLDNEIKQIKMEILQKIRKEIAGKRSLADEVRAEIASARSVAQ